MSDSSTPKAIHKILYDLERNLVQYDRVSAKEHANNIQVLSLWNHQLIEQISKSPPSHENILAYFRRKNTFQLNETKILEKIASLNESEDYKENLKAIVTKIGNQIFKFGSILFELGITVRVKVFKSYIVHLSLTTHGTIDYKRTAFLLVESTSLNEQDKYKIACYFCLDTKVKELLNQLTKDFVNKFIKEFEEDEINQLMTLWYYHVEEQEKELNDCICKLKIKISEKNKYLLFWAIKRGNEVAVQYIWEKLCDASTKENPLQFASRALYFKSLNIVCYLASQINKDDQIKNFYVNDGYMMLGKLANDPRWWEYFTPTSEYALGFIGEMNFICSFKTLVQCWIVNKSKRNFYLEYFNAFIAKFNVKMNKEILYSKTSILSILFELEETINLKALLNVGSNEEIKIIFQDEAKIYPLGLELIIGKNAKLFNQFATEIFVGEEIWIFKNHFFDNTNFKICWEFIEHRKYKELDEFVNLFCKESRLDFFKNNILFQNKGKIIGRAFKIGDERNMNVKDKVDKILKWCFNGNKEKMNDCKITLFHPQKEECSYAKKHFLISLKTLMNKQPQDVVDNFLDWALPGGDSMLKCKAIELSTSMPEGNN